MSLGFFFDYTYVTDCGRWITKEGLEEAQTIYKTTRGQILVELDGRKDAVFAHMVDAKGIAAGWLAKSMLEDMHEVGYGNSSLLIRCDQEFPIFDLHNTIGRMRDGITIPTNSAVGHRKSNGHIENAIQKVSKPVSPDYGHFTKQELIHSIGCPSDIWLASVMGCWIGYTLCQRK